MLLISNLEVGDRFRINGAIYTVVALEGGDSVVTTRPDWLALCKFRSRHLTTAELIIEPTVTHVTMLEA